MLRFNITFNTYSTFWLIPIVYKNIPLIDVISYGHTYTYIHLLYNLKCKSNFKNILRSIVLVVHVWSKVASFFQSATNSFVVEYTNTDTSTKIDSYRHPCRTKTICWEHNCCRGTTIGGSAPYIPVCETWNKQQ